MLLLRYEICLRQFPLLSQPLFTLLGMGRRRLSQGSEYIVGIRNPGFWEIDVKSQTYQGSFWASGKYIGEFTASLESALTEDVCATTKIQGKQHKGWTEYRFQLDPERSAPNSDNTFSLTFDARKVGNGSGLDLGLISLFPPTIQ